MDPNQYTDLTIYESVCTSGLSDGILYFCTISRSSNERILKILG